ncbi:MAG: metalloregulator ArsR/SmtB family transcription factor [Anaerolineae bacterium]
METEASPLLAFFKALADESRLKIVGLLANQPRSVDELAAMLALSAPTVSHHLGRLQQVGLVEARSQQYYSVYALRVDALQEMARQVLSTETLAQEAEGVDQDAFAKKVLKDYLVRGKLRNIPSQLKKRQVILRWLVDKFEAGRHYPEKQVNEILKQVHEDCATLRRELVDYKYMARKDGQYWRL